MPAVFAVLTLCLFGNCLISPGSVPSETDSDLRCQYLPWRQFAFDQLRAGRFPLWNPYQFSGTPFFGDPQSALLYPPNWLNFVLTPSAAASWLMGGHFFLAAYFAGLWAGRRGLGLWPCLLAGTLYACCGSITTNIRAGHLPLLCSAAWLPLLLVCVDGVFDEGGKRRGRWILLGAAVVAMLAVDGFPQFAYDSALAVGGYALLRLWGAEQKARAIGVLVCMYLFGAALAGAQLLASAQVASESVRAGGLSFAEAATYSLPAENLLTLFVPGLFGDRVHLLYFGRWYWWETCVFVGPAAMVLAIYGVGQNKRRCVLAGIMVVTMVVVALGPATPVFSLVYHALPGFHDFRAPGRFAIVADLFLAILAAEGLQRFCDSGASEKDRGRWIVAGGAGLLAVVFGGGAVWAMGAEAQGSGDFARIIQWFHDTGQTMDVRPSVTPGFAPVAASFAAGQLGIAAGVALVVAICLAVGGGTTRPNSKVHRENPHLSPPPEYMGRGKMGAGWRKTERNTRYVGAMLVAILAAGQIVFFAFEQRVTSDRAAPLPDNWAAALASLPAGDRALVYNDLFADGNVLNAVGYNPLVLNRMGKFLAATQNQSVADVGMNAPAATLPPVYRMLRVSLMIPSRYGAAVYPLSDPLPRLKLMSRWTVAQNSDDALADVLQDGFDPAQTVVLESDPGITAASASDAESAPGSARIVRETVNELEIEADVPSPRVLLVSDAYSDGWKVTPLDGGASWDDRVIPGDYCLRAILLGAGHHHFVLEYRPRAVVIGAFVSIAALILYAIALYAICFSRLARPAR